MANSTGTPDTDDVDALWAAFHGAVNMTSRELEDWLRTDAAGTETEATPDEAGRPAGQQVVHVLGKRKGDLTPDDLVLMQRVVTTVRAETDPEAEPQAGDASWRHHLMSIGHDPLKPPS
ncbi:DUF3140 domain-containing protein [Streptomyces sp. NP160]|uniref:DUF3140 domain-containing protein n=1 Tax=Streptomyces sp. NP160 TaxID=2586637 RepID=UPI00111B2663|nr:DUF3140 domain-containing protein [Streptomyces sp. NP160]TNM68544.1 DUF3140 domain-containing protein [Streptomyces sp. NP160]